MQNRWVLIMKSKTSVVSIPRTMDICHSAKEGSEVRPDNTSVTAKHANMMFELLWSLGFLFMAIITKTFSSTVNGQMMALTTMVMIIRTKLTASIAWISVVRSVKFEIVRFDIVCLTQGIVGNWFVSLSTCCFTSAYLSRYLEAKLKKEANVLFADFLTTTSSQ